MSVRSIFRPLPVGIALALVSAGGMVFAQIDGAGKGVAPIDSSSSFEVTGVLVDVHGKDAESARQGGWRVAQRKGWAMLSQRLTGKATTLSDSALDAMVSAVVVENEQLGTNRYVARLGVLFDRGRAGAILGVGGQVARSPAMLLVPVQWSGGAGHVFEGGTPWQQAWARFRTGSSTIDYVRPTGTGTDPLLLNVGQINRRGRGWWRNIIDQYGTSDVLIAEVQLQRQYPGGPVTGVFTARHGPDNRRIAGFTLRVNSASAIDALLDAGVKRMDEIYQRALSGGMLQTDALLSTRPPTPQELQPEEETEEVEIITPTEAVLNEGAAVTIQFETPSVGSVTSGEAALRAVPGVRSASTTSLALGGVSVMRVAYDGPIGGLAAALSARGWQVQEGNGVLRISRRSASPTPSGENTPG